MPFTKKQLALFQVAAKGKSKKMGKKTGKKMVKDAHGTKAVPKAGLAKRLFAGLRPGADTDADGM